MSESKVYYEDYVIIVKYSAKLTCSEIELLAEFNSCWPVIGNTWQKSKNTSTKSTRMLRFWVHISQKYCIEYPNLTELALIFLSISPDTGPLERSYAKPAKICYKDRSNISSEVLQILFLLATLCVKDDKHLFKTARRILLKESGTNIYYSQGFI